MDCAGCATELSAQDVSDLYCGEECQAAVMASGTEPLYELTLRDLGYTQVDYGDHVALLPVPQ